MTTVDFIFLYGACRVCYSRRSPRAKSAVKEKPSCGGDRAHGSSWGVRGTHQGDCNGAATTAKPVNFSAIAIGRILEGEVADVARRQ
jgi:hypothetical protein